MPIFEVTIKKQVESVMRVEASSAEQARARAYMLSPVQIEDWHCDVFKGTTFRVEEVEG